MTDKQIIIDDQKKTIHRLQDECTEKTNAIIALGEQLKRAEKTMQEIWDRLGETTDNLQAKEQECEELKKIIDEAKNSKLDLKSFLVGEAIQNEYEQQLDQLKEQLEAYKMEAEEGKEINAELKAENEELKKIIERLDVPKHEVIDMDIALENEKLKQTLTEIKEICKTNVCKHCHSKLKVDDNYCKNIKDCDCYNILQKISEVEEQC